jgi:riboflavin kinase / FMN adenylyltransferase
MIHAESIDQLDLQYSWLTVGVFDGVHRGHQQIIRKLTAGAHEMNAPAVVLTFWPHPATVLGNTIVKCLTTPDERAKLLFDLGVDVVITQTFDREVANTSAHGFAARLKQHLGMQRILMGYDFALGKGREGDAARLTVIGQELGYAVEVIPAISDESGVISSTEIRKLVGVGDVAEAARLLGHPYSVHGTVIHGDGRGRSIGIPTANIDYSRDKVIPPNGIYACWIPIEMERYRAMTNIGINPTFTPDKQSPNVEAHLLDFDRDLYGQDLKVEIVERLRDEIKYSSVEALVSQIHMDIKKGREILSSQ